MRLVVPHFRRTVRSACIDLRSRSSVLGRHARRHQRWQFWSMQAAASCMPICGLVARCRGRAPRRERTSVVNDTGAVQMLADTFASACNGDTALGVKGIAVPLFSRNGERHIAYVCRSSDRRRQAARAAAALFVYKADLVLHLRRRDLQACSPQWSCGYFAVVEVAGARSSRGPWHCRTSVKILSDVYKKINSVGDLSSRRVLDPLRLAS